MSGRCRCGKTHQDCAADWDKQLGIVGHGADNRQAEYWSNVRAINRAKGEGLDPYHHQLNTRRRK